MNYDFIDVIHLDSFIKVNNININQRIFEFSSLVESPDFEVYTDGSGIGDNVGTAVCIFKDNDLFESFQFKLASYNSVFQADLSAINFAASWALENGYEINIFTDSLSSMAVPKKANSKSLFINQLKSKMFQAIGSVGLSWVKADDRIPGNELADQYARIATTDGQGQNIPAAYTYVKRKIKNYILDSWQRYWKDSAKGVTVKGYIPTVDLNLLTHNRQLLFLISGHVLFLLIYIILNKLIALTAFGWPGGCRPFRARLPLYS
ncbi:hypothetical protein AVEN_49214-1 [Araneus ventricosus]|uniref:RNase H type-1 domain-containing protein n=1 Tax=Araneus ventricosus TaxID=182803 RepID=A0A4Y2M3G3_ARAVE|nr:hypothetical protein AVEN_49214-1 [Araneus ventricosus]